MPREDATLTAIELAERIRELIAEQGWESDSAYRLHKRSGISERYAADLISGRGPRRPRQETLEKLAGAFGISVAEFIGEPERAVATSVSLTGGEEDVLAALAARDRVSTDAIMNRAIKDYLDREGSLPSIRRVVDAIENARSEPETTVLQLAEREHGANP